MRVDLPSAGKLGFSYYEINEPKLGQLRNVSNYPDNEILCKNQFILDCSPEKEYEKFYKLTVCDRDYLFIVLVCAINLNKVACTSTCTCGEVINFSFELFEKDFILLEGELTYTTDIYKDTYGEELTYNIMTVEQELGAVEYSRIKPDNQYDNTLEAALIAQTLGFGASDEGVEKVLNLDLAIYYSALFYQLCYFHGVIAAVEISCPQCRKKAIINTPFKKALLMVDITSIMKSFVAFSPILDFQSFCTMTVLELQNLRVLLQSRNSG
jgi:hypothetical protein